MLMVSPYEMAACCEKTIAGVEVRFWPLLQETENEFSALGPHAVAVVGEVRLELSAGLADEVVGQAEVAGPGSESVQVTGLTRATPAVEVAVVGAGIEGIGAYEARVAVQDDCPDVVGSALAQGGGDLPGPAERGSQKASPAIRRCE